MKRLFKNTLIIISFILTLLAMCVFLSNPYFSKDRIVTEGEIIEAKQTSNSRYAFIFERNMQKYRAKITFRDQNGKDHQIKKRVSVPKDLNPIGYAVKLYYKPNKPEKAENHIGVFYYYGSIIFCILILISLIVKFRRINQNRPVLGTGSLAPSFRDNQKSKK